MGKVRIYNRNKNKELQCAKILDEVVNEDHVFGDMISKLYNGKSILVWSLEFLKTAPQKTYERMRLVYRPFVSFPFADQRA